MGLDYDLCASIPADGAVIGVAEGIYVAILEEIE